jgi:hypothetical protein
MSHFNEVGELPGIGFLQEGNVSHCAAHLRPPVPFHSGDGEKDVPWFVIFFNKRFISSSK